MREILKNLRAEKIKDSAKDSPYTLKKSEPKETEVEIEVSEGENEESDKAKKAYNKSKATKLL